jgi:haloacetate dehalogenase
MFTTFRQTQITTQGATINLRIGGSGAPVLLLHGYPQTHVMWHRVAPQLAEHFTVVVPDLRGYGDSSKPPSGDDHIGYAKRTMAQDQVEVMRALGFERFAVVGHDRGARVAHRMTLDYVERVERMAVLDIVPTHYVFSHVTKELATLYYHWFFLTQPGGLPEKLIGADPIYYLRAKLGSWGAQRDSFAPEAVAEYERCFSDPATIHATCEDYRAAATIDLVHDEADRGRRVTCPLLVLWGTNSIVGRLHEPLDIWRDYATDVRGRGLPCGHYLAEERPDETVRELLTFLQSG